MEENLFRNNPSSPSRSKKAFPKRFIFLLAFIILVLIIMGIRVLSSGQPSENTPTPTPTEFELPTDTPTPEEKETPTPKETESPTPKPTTNPIDKSSGLDRSKLKVAIQNGSGEAGVGAKASDYLKSLGYNVISISNADNFNYSNVSIKVSSPKSDFLSLLKKDMGFNYTVGDTSSDLSGTSSAEAIVIIGK